MEVGEPVAMGANAVDKTSTFSGVFKKKKNALLLAAVERRSTGAVAGGTWAGLLGVAPFCASQTEM